MEAECRRSDANLSGQLVIILQSHNNDRGIYWALSSVSLSEENWQRKGKCEQLQTKIFGFGVTDTINT